MSGLKGPCSPEQLCALVFLFWKASFAKFSVLIGQSDRFFHAWPKHDSTHTEDNYFQLSEINFSGVQGTQSHLGEHGPLRCRKTKDVVNCMIKLWFNFILELNVTFPCFKLINTVTIP